MRYFSLHRILALINMVVLLVLLADVFLLPATHLQEVYDNRSWTETGSSYRSHAFSIDYIHAVSKDVFQVPANWQNTNIGLNKGDTFYVDKSAIFGQALRLYFPWQGGFGRMPMAALNNGYFGPLLVLYILIVSLLVLFPGRLIQKDYSRQVLVLTSTASLVVLGIYFFYH